MTTMTLAEAIASMKLAIPNCDMTPEKVMDANKAARIAIATILNAVVKGELRYDKDGGL